MITIRNERKSIYYSDEHNKIYTSHFSKLLKRRFYYDGSRVFHDRGWYSEKMIFIGYLTE